MNVIDEWIDTIGAKQDEEKFFSTACLMQGRSCGKTAFAMYQIKKYLEDHPDATVVMPYHHGYSYIKEFMNSIYYKKPPYDVAPLRCYPLCSRGVRDKAKRGDVRTS